MFYFGAQERRLLGIYEAARHARANRAVVLCHPWGAEYIHGYRAMRQLAKMLTANGIHTLRFDYFGTGDSAGSTTAGDLSGWETDIQSAIEELKDTTGASQGFAGWVASRCNARGERCRARRVGGQLARSLGSGRVWRRVSG